MNISITIDVEKDLGSVDTFYGIDEGLPLILDVFKKNNIKATFFISGEVADYLEKNRYIYEIVKFNHEIASHGYYHNDYRNYPLDKIRKELMLSKEILNSFTKEPIIGFRAPQFRINEKIINVLKELDFKYDSSVPAPNSISGASILRNVKISYEEIKYFEKMGIKEFQINSIPFIKLPHGLLWVNLIGLNFYKFLFKKLNNEDLIIFYLHPFDVMKNKRKFKYPTLIEKIFYNIKSNNSIELFLEIINFWKSKNVKFWTIRDFLLEKF